MNFSREIKGNILWDFRLEDEFKGERHNGYAFVVDVCDKKPRLALYMIKDRLSKTQTLQDKQQPPEEMMFRVVEEQGGNMNLDDLYNINEELRNWVENNLLQG